MHLKQEHRIGPAPDRGEPVLLWPRRTSFLKLSWQIYFYTHLHIIHLLHNFFSVIVNLYVILYSNISLVSRSRCIGKYAFQTFLSARFRGVYRSLTYTFHYSMVWYSLRCCSAVGPCISNTIESIYILCGNCKFRPEVINARWYIIKQVAASNFLAEDIRYFFTIPLLFFPYW